MPSRNFLEHLHEEHLKAIAREKSSPYVQYIEDFYVRHRAGYEDKIRTAGWIPRETRAHMIEHVRFRLQKKPKKGKTFGDFLRDPDMRTASTKRYRYFKVTRAKGGVQIVKKDRKTGRFTPLTKREKRDLAVNSRSPSQNKKGAKRKRAR